MYNHPTSYIKKANRKVTDVFAILYRKLEFSVLKYFEHHGFN